MLLETYVVGRLQANCYVVGDEATREVLVIDPGDDVSAILEGLRGRERRVAVVVVTHHHLDHSGGAHDLLEAAPGARFLMSRLDYPGVAAQAPSAGMWYGHPVTPPREPDAYLEDGDVVEVGALRFTAMLTPGHTPGSICLAGEGLVFTGDVLFRDSIGRFDFPGGDGRELLRSIKRRLLTLPPETRVLSGHGPETTIEREARFNPFVVMPEQVLGFDVD